MSKLTKLTRLRLWLLDHLPAGVIARPAEWFLASLCLLTGPPILLGISEPKSVQTLLWAPIFTGWGAAMTLGGLGLACGLSSYKRTPGGNWTITRVPCYRLGLRLLGLSAGLYAVAVLIAGGLDALFAAVITLAFAGMCWVRLLSLGHPR
jgi:hypothetical protein